MKLLPTFWLALLGWGIGMFTSSLAATTNTIVLIGATLAGLLALYVASVWYDAMLEDYYHRKCSTPHDQGGWQ